MFSSAIKSFSSTNITANYTLSPSPSSTAGPWKIYDCKKKSSGKACSAFVFERKSLEPGHGSGGVGGAGAGGGGGGRSARSAAQKAGDEVVERLRKEAAGLARLRHPSVLELVEPVEDTRGGGLQFVTEAVTASLAGLLADKDEQERGGGVGGRSSRFVVEDADGVRRRRELEIDELEIQKGLLQVSKALEFLHENAGLVHGNLTPDAILINAKSDWKMSGLSFCSPPQDSEKATSFQPISLSEVLNLDPRLPRFVQLNLDYSSPDFVLDGNLTTSADMFSLGLLAVALYNSPHRSPFDCHGSVSAYRRLFASSSSLPAASNDFLSRRPLPRDLTAHVLPRLLTRRPANRMTAREFQHSPYFDNILVSTIRFLDTFPAKTPGEKSQFLRGLAKVLPEFPRSVMEKKLLPALLDEMKDKELLSLILQNVFRIVDLLPAARRAFGDKVRPCLKETFVTNAKQSQEKDPPRDAGLMVVLEHLSSIAGNCSGKDFKDDMLPILLAAIESPTPSVVDASLKSLMVALPVLDFSTIKNELFPVVAQVFSRTNSLAIKIRGLNAFVVLCGGSPADSADGGGLDDFAAEGSSRKTSSSSALDKYTMQEKIVPLVKAIKTKEPAVMMAALKVLRVVGQAADGDFVATEILPVLWAMSLNPHFNLQQFQSVMDLVRSLSRRVEDEQTKKLQELAGGEPAAAAVGDDFMGFGGVSGTAFEQTNGAEDDDFERLVKGKSASDGSSAFPSWDDEPSAAAPAAATRPKSTTPKTPAFSWSTPSPTGPSHAPLGFGATKAAQQQPFRTITPDLARFETMTPSSTQFSQPLQPTSAASQAQAQAQTTTSPAADWSSAPGQSNPWASMAPASPAQAQPGSAFGNLGSSMSSLSMGQQRPAMSQSSSFALPPPPRSSGVNASSTSSTGNGAFGKPAFSTASSSFSLPPPPGGQMQMQMQSSNAWASAGGGGGGSSSKPGGMMGQSGGMNNGGLGSMGSMGSGMGMGMNSMMGSGAQAAPQAGNTGQKSGLDKYASLL